MPKEVPVLYQCPAGRRRSGSSTPGGGGTALSYDELHLPTSVAPSPHPSHLCFCTSPWQQLIWKPTVDVRGKETAKTTPRWFWAGRRQLQPRDSSGEGDGGGYRQVVMVGRVTAGTSWRWWWAGRRQGRSRGDEGQSDGEGSFDAVVVRRATAGAGPGWCLER